jgi:hypothetical protein
MAFFLQEINDAAASSPADVLQLLRQQNDYHHDQHHQQQQQSPPIITSIVDHFLAPVHRSPLVSFHAATIIISCHAVAGLPLHVLHDMLQV